MLTARRARQQIARGRIECALRLMSGEHEGLSTRWRHGIAAVERGRIDLTPYVWQLRLPRPGAKTVEITVTSVDPEDRRAAIGELWSLDADTRVMAIETPTASLLWAVSPHQAEWALSRLGGTASDPQERQP